MRTFAGSLVLFVCSSALTGRAGAQVPQEPAVTRGPGAEDCPDAQALALRIASIRGRAAPPEATRYQVAFSRDEQEFSALIQSDAAPSSARRLRAKGLDCTALAEATAVTLALLLDSDPATTGNVRPSKNTETPIAVQPAPSRDASQSETPNGAHATLSLAMTGLFGVVQPFAPGIVGEIGLEVARLRTSVGALWVVPQTIELAPGTVHESLISGIARACVAPWQTDPLRFDVCSGVLVGVLKAEARGYTQNEQSTKPWLALPLELAFAGLYESLGWEVSAAALIALRRHDFSVDGLGVAYRSLPVGAMLSLRGFALWSL